MSNPAQHDTIDLSASTARIRSARSLAAAQARRVEAALDGADKTSIDLLFLLQENVLVMTETHLMLQKLAGMDARRQGPAPRKQEPIVAQPSSDDTGWRLPGRRVLTSAAVLALAIMASACLLEIVDPAPMDVEARIVHFFGSRR